MNNKAFTLLELLAVITVLSIIFAVATPAYVNYMNNAKEDIYKNQEKALIAATKEYYFMHLNDLPKTNNATTASNPVTVKDLLVKGNLAEFNIKSCNPLTSYIVAKNCGSINKIGYIVYLDCDDYEGKKTTAEVNAGSCDAWTVQ